MEYLFKFPESLRIGNGEAIDIAVKAFSRNHRETLGLIKSAVIASINSINSLLEAIPWPLLILLAAYMGWRVSKKTYVGPMYAAMLFFIGVCGLWENMLETISMVIVAVFDTVLRVDILPQRCFHHGGLNIVGLRRAGFTAEQRAQIKQAFGVLYRSGLNTTQARERLLADTANPFAAEYAEFLAHAKRGICRPSFNISDDPEADA